MQTIASICTFCGVGCGLGLRVEDGRVVGVEPQPGHPVSAGQLCAKGWASGFAIDTGNRLRMPLIKEHGQFREASWDEALALVASEFRAALEAVGPDGVGVISCAHATNEDNYAAQKFARAVLGTANIDHCARICHSPSVAGLSRTLGSGAMTNSIADIDEAGLILVIGADVTENHAMIGARMLRAQARGARLIVVDPRRTRLARLADQHVQLRVGSNIALLNGLLHIIFANGWEDRDFLACRCDNEAALRAHVRDLTPEIISAQTGVPVLALIELARAYSQARRAFIAYGMGITQFQSGTHNVIAVANLALVYLDTARWIDARALLSTATERLPQSAVLWLDLGIAERGLGDTTGAVAAFRRALDLDAQNRGGHAARAAAFLALLYQETGQPAEAVSAARQALAWKPTDVEALTYLGLAQQSLGDLAAARDALEQAAQLAPDRAELHNNLGTIYYDLGDDARAEASFSRALTLRPEFSAAAANLDSLRRRRAEAAVRPPGTQASSRRPRSLGARFSATNIPAVGLRGLLAESVTTNGIAAAGGLRKGDLVLLVDGKEILTPDKLDAYVAASTAETLVLDILRESRPLRVTVKLR